jgi:hypothetical protein
MYNGNASEGILSHPPLFHKILNNNNKERPHSLARACCCTFAHILNSIILRGATVGIKGLASSFLSQIPVNGPKPCLRSRYYPVSNPGITLPQIPVFGDHSCLESRYSEVHPHSCLESRYSERFLLQIPVLTAHSCLRSRYSIPASDPGMDVHPCTLGLRTYS